MNRCHEGSLDLAEVESREFTWLLTQSLELKTSRAQILGGVVSEWFNQHPHTQRDQVWAGDFIREALDKFIVSHAAEFMPVAFQEWFCGISLKDQTNSPCDF